MELSITPAADKFMRRMVRFSDQPAGGFRLSVSAGGCSGLASEFTVEAAPQGNDSTVEFDGLKLFLPAESRLLLQGVTIDFADSPTKSGLVFINPNATACGCSSSEPASPAAMPGVAAVSISSIGRRA